MAQKLNEMRDLLAEVQADIDIARKLDTGIDVNTLEKTARDLIIDIAAESGS